MLGRNTWEGFEGEKGREIMSLRYDLNNKRNNLNNKLKEVLGINS